MYPEHSEIRALKSPEKYIVVIDSTLPPMLDSLLSKSETAVTTYGRHAEPQPGVASASGC